MRVTRIVDKVYTNKGVRREVYFFARDARECGAGPTAAIATLQVRRGRSQRTRGGRR